MDNGTIRSAKDRVRMFPGYTLAELEVRLLDVTVDPEVLSRIRKEVEARRVNDTVRKFCA